MKRKTDDNSKIDKYKQSSPISANFKGNGKADLSNFMKKTLENRVDLSREDTKNALFKAEHKIIQPDGPKAIVDLQKDYLREQTIMAIVKEEENRME